MNRKKLTTLIMALLFLLTSTIAYTSDRDYDAFYNSVSFDVLTPILSNAINLQSGLYSIPISISYQRLVSPHLVLCLLPSFIYTATIDEPTSYFMFFLPWIELDWHPFREDLSGFYIGPSICMPYVMEKDSSGVLHKLMAIEGGASIGYKTKSWKRLAIDLSFGATFGPVIYSSPESIVGELSSSPKMNLAIGVVF